MCEIDKVFDAFYGRKTFRTFWLNITLTDYNSSDKYDAMQVMYLCSPQKPHLLSNG